MMNRYGREGTIAAVTMPPATPAQGTTNAATANVELLEVE
jgi:hypothetical protein